jgi:nitrilase
MEGREEFRRYYDGAIDVPGEETTVLGELAFKYGLTVVIGVVERDRGTLYCSVLFFGSDGRIKGKHRKIMPTAMERLIWGLGDGSTMPAIDTEFGTLGSAICWENYMPLFRTAMYAKGVTLWCAPTVDDREEWQATMRHIAVEGRCFVLSACQYMMRSGYPENLSLSEKNPAETVLIKGGSVIVSPFGKVLAGPLYDKEGILTAELDLSDSARGKFDLDVVGHYARPDIFTLAVDQRPKKSVAIDGE